MSAVVSIIDDMGMNDLYNFDTYEKAFNFVVEYHGVEDYRDNRIKDGLSGDELEEDVLNHIDEQISDNIICSGGYEITCV